MSEEVSQEESVVDALDAAIRQHGHRVSPGDTLPSRGVTRRQIVRPASGPPPGPFAEAMRRWKNAPKVEAVERLREMFLECVGLLQQANEAEEQRAQVVAEGGRDGPTGRLDSLTAEASRLRERAAAIEAAIPAAEVRIREQLREHYTAELAELNTQMEESNEALKKTGRKYEKLRVKFGEAAYAMRKAQADNRGLIYARLDLTKKIDALDR
jgi:chromosome segregation ATPase